MTIVNYFNEPAPVAWAVAAAIFGASGLEGIVPDVSDPNAIFQTNTAYLPAGPGDPVGLMLDKRLKPGPEQFANTDFSEWSNALPVGWTVQQQDATRYVAQDPDGLRMVWSGGGNLLRVFRAVGDDRPRWIEIDVIVNSGYIALSGGSGGSLVSGTQQINTTGTYRFYASRNVGAIGFKAQGTDGDVVVKRFSVREIPGIHLSQATAAARMTYGRFPKTGRRNTLTPSSEVMAGTWAVVGITIDGTRIVATGGSLQQHRLDKIMALDAGATWSAEVSAAGHRYMVFRYTNADTVFDLEEGVVVSNNNPDAGIEAVPDKPGRYITWVTTGQSGSQTLRVNTSPTPNTNAFMADGVSGTNIFWQQVEQGPRTPYQKVASTFDVTEEGVPDVWYLRPDLTDDALTAVLPQAINGDIMIAGANGSIIEPITYAANTAFSLGPTTYTGGTPGLLRATGDIIGLLLIDKALSDLERGQLISYYKSKGAEGLLQLGPELCPNVGWPFVTLDHISSAGTGGASHEIENGNIKVTRGSGTTYLYVNDIPLTVGKTYRVVVQGEAGVNSYLTLNNPSGIPSTSLNTADLKEFYFTPNNTAAFRFQMYGIAEGSTAYLTGLSVKEIRAQEDWS